ncbi:MAG: cation:proton antiporter [Acidobacteriales bacterium]|nr:cation:proton antiporter [Terriglobales bacterium]
MPHQANELLLELFFIFVWTKFFGEVFEQLRLPAVLGEILAGIALGPFAFGLIEPSDTLYSVAQVGAIFLLFTVGLETHPKELIRVGPKALQVALAGIVVPFALGFGYMILRGEAAHQATFVAAAMVATSVGITARIMHDMDVMGTRAARIILGAAVFDDIGGMILLAVVVALAAAGPVDYLQIGIVTAEAVGFVLFMMFIAPRVIRRVEPELERLQTRNPQLILALAICLGLSVAAERIGLAAIIGAFFAGMVFAEFSGQWKLQPRVNAINEFLAPFFFFSIGARLNIHVFGGDVWKAAIVVSLLAIISKLIGCGLPVLNEGRLTAAQVGVGMTPRGEVGLIVALIGLQLQMISDSAYAVVIFMTATTTLFAPPILRYLFMLEKRSAAAAAAAGREPPLKKEPVPDTSSLSRVE